MNQDLSLGILGRIVAWDDGPVGDELRWLQMMARLRCEGYRDFQAGTHFIENLVTRLRQFKSSDREIAYRFAWILSSAVLQSALSWTRRKPASTQTQGSYCGPATKGAGTVTIRNYSIILLMFRTTDRGDVDAT